MNELTKLRGKGREGKSKSEQQTREWRKGGEERRGAVSRVSPQESLASGCESTGC